MARKPRRTSQLLGTTLVALLLLAQSLGLQQLCLCGSCAISEALGLGAEQPELHRCCAERARAQAAAESSDTRPRWSRAGDPCGCGAEAHAPHDEPAVHRDLPTLREPLPALAVLACQPAPIAVTGDPSGVYGAVRSRGPPSADGPPLYLQYRMLRI